MCIYHITKEKRISAQRDKMNQYSISGVLFSHVIKPSENDNKCMAPSCERYTNINYLLRVGQEAATMVPMLRKQFSMMIML